MFWGWDIKFRYVKDGKPYLFQWQHWNWIELYEDNKRFCEDNNNLTINGSEIMDEKDLIEKMDQCIIDCYKETKKHIDQQNQEGLMSQMEVMSSVKKEVCGKSPDNLQSINRYATIFLFVDKS